MIRSSSTICACSLAALALGGALTLAGPLAAQAQSGGFTLPQSSPTPTPAPEGPADERAGVVIPPRSAPPPRIAPAPVLTPEPEVTLPPRPQPTTARPAARPAPSPSPTRSPAAVPSASPATTPIPAPERAPEIPSPAGAPSDPLAVPSVLPLPSPDPAPSLEAAPAESASVLPELPEWWVWAAGGLGGLAALGLGALLLRRRQPKPLRLAATPEGLANAAPAPAKATQPAAGALDIVLDVTGATRSLMMFTLHYRLALANRTGQAISDVNLAVLLACARAGADNAVAAGAAQQLERFDRIGPHQNLAVTGSVQLPLSAIAPLHQGRTPLLIPLAHVTLEAEGQSAETRSFVIGTLSAAGTGRLHPIPLDTPPGSINGLMAQRIAVPALSAAA